jgi:phosphomannomutase
VVNDKDGISAALMLARMVTWLSENNRTMHEYLDEIWAAVGYHATQQISIRVSELSKIPVLLDSLRNQTPTHFGKFAITAFEDLSRPSNDLPPTNGLRFFCSDGVNDRAIRVIMRPSGTEPKMKIYLEVARGPVDSPEKIRSERQIADTMISELNTAVSEIPQKLLGNG